MSNTTSPGLVDRTTDASDGGAQRTYLTGTGRRGVDELYERAPRPPGRLVMQTDTLLQQPQIGFLRSIFSP
jgi:hypothetical protein